MSGFIAINRSTGCPKICWVSIPERSFHKVRPSSPPRRLWTGGRAPLFREYVSHDPSCADTPHYLRYHAADRILHPGSLP